MTLLFMDGFDHYATADVLKKWTSGGCTINASAGRRSGGAMQISNNASQVMTKVLGAAKSTLIFGAAFLHNAVPNANYELIRFRDGATDQVSLVFESTGKLSVRRGTAGGTVLATSTNALTSGFHYIEFKATLHNTTGAFEVRVDGSLMAGLSATGVDTTSTANNSADTLLLGTVSGSGLTQTYDDLYVCDDQGSAANNFLGDCRIDPQYPTSDGANQTWTPSTGTTHYTLVDETTPNTTDYVESSTAGQKDTYGMGDITHTPLSIIGVQVNIAALKDDAGARSIKPVTRSGGTDYSGTEQALSTAQVYYREIRETDPATSAAWTKTGVNAAEFGVECV